MHVTGGQSCVRLANHARVPGGRGRSTARLATHTMSRPPSHHEVLLEPGEVSADLLAARLHAAVVRAGFADAAGLMAQAGADPVAAVDVMVDSLEGESCATTHTTSRATRAR